MMMIKIKNTKYIVDDDSGRSILFELLLSKTKIQ